MISVRAIGRRVVLSPFVWAALSVCAAIVIGSPRSQAKLLPEPIGWAATPSVPCPLFLQAGLEIKLVRDSFESFAPAVRPAPHVAAMEPVERVCGHVREHRRAIARFSPLYRRPPPSFS